jgi:two-component system cell cycle sensor histidine kinase/response regulator CckA
VDTPSGSGGTVLVVDDDSQVRALAARALADAGFDVLQVADAASALDLLNDPLPTDLCLVITDIAMPGMQGDELGRILRDSRPTLPVLYMSGFSRPHLEFLTADELQLCWIEKPFSVQVLVDKVRALCQPARTD